MHHPSLNEFSELAVNHDFVPVYRRLLSDALTPVSAFRLLDRATGSDDKSVGACLFESVIGGEKVGRYSFLAASPTLRFSAFRNEVTVTDLTGQTPPETFSDPDPLNLFRQHFQKRVATLDELPPFVGGAIGYAGYDVVRYVENLPNAPEDDRGLPDLDFSFYHTLCVFDHVAKTIDVVRLADCREVSGAEDAKAVYAAACHEVDATIGKLAASGADSDDFRPGTWDEATWRAESKEHPIEVRSNFTRESFGQAVRDCVEYIRAGDIFQVVPSQRLAVEDRRRSRFEIYRSLRVVNPSPFMFYLRTPDCVLGGLFTRDHVPRRRFDGDGPSARRHAPTRWNRERRQGA